jgi:NAD(P)-dependent dehydrogenase (short-subunit alcohol dehydrogenase family)
MGYADEVFDLTGKVVVVTGGSRGLGRQIATAVARQGADVVIASRKLAACEEAANDIKNETGRQAMAYGVHVGQPPEIIGAALFLASDASSYTSGAIIRVDGGMF